MVVAFAVTIDDDHSLQFSRRVRNDIYRGTYYAIGQRWQTKWLPRHFTRRARHIYKYRQRTTKWMQRKKREAKRSSKIKKGGRVDLVYTGLAEQLFERRHAVRAFPTRVSINMHGPRYITMRPKKGGSRHALAPEVLKIVDDELRDLDGIAQQTMEALIKKAPRKRKRIRGR